MQSLTSLVSITTLPDDSGVVYGQVDDFMASLEGVPPCPTSDTCISMSSTDHECRMAERPNSNDTCANTYTYVDRMSGEEASCDLNPHHRNPRHMNPHHVGRSFSPHNTNQAVDEYIPLSVSSSDSGFNGASLCMAQLLCLKPNICYVTNNVIETTADKSLLDGEVRKERELGHEGCFRGTG